MAENDKRYPFNKEEPSEPPMRRVYAGPKPPQALPTPPDGPMMMVYAGPPMPSAPGGFAPQEFPPKTSEEGPETDFRCPWCGSYLSAPSKYCPECGALLEEPK